MEQWAMRSLVTRLRKIYKTNYLCQKLGCSPSTLNKWQRREHAVPAKHIPMLQHLCEMAESPGPPVAPPP